MEEILLEGALKKTEEEEALVLVTEVDSMRTEEAIPAQAAVEAVGEAGNRGESKSCIAGLKLISWDDP